MIRNLILLMSLGLGSVQASEEKYFMRIPASFNDVEALTALSHAALNRRWTVSEIGNKQLRIKLTHALYNADLNFSLVGQEIMYSDSSTFLNEDEEYPNKEAETTLAPVKWIKYLQADLNKFFIIMERIKDKNNKIQAHH